MSSLTAHLLEPGDHGRLSFHPSCPVCRRERLSGTLSTEPVVSRRTRAVLASGVLAFSGGAPGLAVAAVPDRQAEGVAAPEEPPGSELDDPEFDPGGETSLPFETAPVPSETADDDGAGPPIDAEPVDDLDGRLAPLVAEGEAQTEQDASPLNGEVPPATGDGTTGMPTTPAVEDVVAPDSTSTAPERETERRGSADRSDRRDRHPDERSTAGVRDGATPVAQAPVVRAPITQAPAPPAVEATVTVPATGPAPTPRATAVAERQPGPSLRNARTYVVQPGDSLWSIAKRLVGADASPARIARAVDRLWSANQERIATGDPDLLHVGTELKLR